MKNDPVATARGSVTLRVNFILPGTKNKTKAQPCSRARTASMPEIIHPMLATLVDEPFSNPEWIEQIEKFHLEGMIAKRAASHYIQKRSSDWLKIKTVKRSEVVIGGYTQPRGGRKGGVEALRGKGHIVYYPFDLLYRDGYDLMSCPLIERKAMLEEILSPANFIKLSDHIVGDGEEFFEQIEKFHLEGMIAKRAASHYVQKIVGAAFITSDTPAAASIRRCWRRFTNSCSR